MTYKVMGVGDGWIELWDQTSLVSPDLPRNKALDKFYIGEHPFQVNDIVELSVRLVARIIEPTEGALVPLFEGNGDREDREVFDQHG